jgi:hypothetical protein
MKKLILLLLSLSATLAYAQPKSNSPVATLPLTAKDSLLCKAWKTISIEVFGTINTPNEKQAADGVTYMLDGTAFLTMDGVPKTGKWTFDRAKTYATIEIDDTKEKFRFKIITLTKDQLIYEYQDPELIRTKYTCAPLKK